MYWNCEKFAIIAAVVSLFVTPITAQNRRPGLTPAPSAAADTYREYCAVCHGKMGRGDGPAPSELKVRPPDLTLLAQRHRGKFPSDYVSDVLRNGVALPAHGTIEMPIWGPLFSALDGQFQSQVKLRIQSLVTYLKSLQR